MIVKETVAVNGRELRRTYSDRGFMIEREGVLYSEALDPIEFEREYVETDILIESEENTDE